MFSTKCFVFSNFPTERKLYEYMNTDEFSLEQIQIARKTFTFLLSSPF